ncbi:MAG: DUF5011 domain-containing protein [Firmicutes bacterium]|nr:DUF5011 domain-containing protein [Bacillota bacterium]
MSRREMSNNRIAFRLGLLVVLAVVLAIFVSAMEKKLDAREQAAPESGQEQQEQGDQGEPAGPPETPDTGSEGSDAEQYPDSDHLTVGLKGSKIAIVRQGDPYIESGAFAVDDRTGALTGCEIKGSVDTSTPGDYTVSYTFTSENAKATVERTVRVVPESAMEWDSDGIPVLMYHWVYTETDQPGEINGNWILNTDLEDQLRWLKENDYYHPSFSELRAYADGQISLPAKSVILTFDDGVWAFFNYGVPLLEQYETPAVAFIIGVNAEEEDLTKYASPYMEYESHSYNMHQPGGYIGHGGIISAMTQEEIEADLREAIALTGSSDAFAYPYGDVTDDAIYAVENVGIKCAFTTEYGPVERGMDFRQFPRVRIQGDYSLDGFIASLF